MFLKRQTTKTADSALAAWPNIAFSRRALRKLSTNSFRNRGIHDAPLNPRMPISPHDIPRLCSNSNIDSERNRLAVNILSVSAGLKGSNAQDAGIVRFGKPRGACCGVEAVTGTSESLRAQSLKEARSACASGSGPFGGSPIKRAESALWDCSEPWAWEATRLPGQCSTSCAGLWFDPVGSSSTEKLRSTKPKLAENETRFSSVWRQNNEANRLAEYGWKESLTTADEFSEDSSVSTSSEVA